MTIECMVVVIQAGILTKTVKKPIKVNIQLLHLEGWIYLFGLFRLNTIADFEKFKSHNWKLSLRTQILYYSLNMHIVRDACIVRDVCMM